MGHFESKTENTFKNMVLYKLTVQKHIVIVLKQWNRHAYKCILETTIWPAKINALNHDTQGMGKIRKSKLVLRRTV